MAVDFEAATAALFARLSAVDGIKYATRALEAWTETPPSVQPSLMLVSGNIEVFEPPSATRGISPPMWLVHNDVVLYVAEVELREISSIRLNEIIAGVCNALLYRPPLDTNVAGSQFLAVPPGTYGTTLGGLCAFARVSGTIERYEGVLGHIAQAIIPIEMVLAS